jgi:hypothetical protein
MTTETPADKCELCGETERHTTKCPVSIAHHEQFNAALRKQLAAEPTPASDVERMADEYARHTPGNDERKGWLDGYAAGHSAAKGEVEGLKLELEKAKARRQIAQDDRNALEAENAELKSKLHIETGLGNAFTHGHQVARDELAELRFELDEGVKFHSNMKAERDALKKENEGWLRKLDQAGVKYDKDWLKNGSHVVDCAVVSIARVSDLTEENTSLKTAQKELVEALEKSQQAFIQIHEHNNTQLVQGAMTAIVNALTKLSKESGV